MFVSLPSRQKAALRWATPLLFVALWLAFLWSLGRPDEARRSLWLESEGVAVRPTQKVAAFADQERMFDSLRDALERVHFLWGPKTDSLMHAVRHLIARARPSPNEVRILFGLARQLRWVAEHGVSVAPVDPEPADG